MSRVDSVSSARGEFFSGVRAQLPLMVGVVPFGLIYGALAVQLKVPAPVAQAMSSIIFAGSSQFIAAPLISTGTPSFIIVLTVWVVNLRHALYSASVAPFLKPLPRRWKFLLAYLLTDEAYAVTITHYLAPGVVKHKHWFFLGTAATLWSCWQISTAIGVFVGAQIPASWSLDFALPLTFIAIVVPMLKNRAYVFASFVAGGVGVLAINFPYKLGLMLAALLGVIAGMMAQNLE